MDAEKSETGISCRRVHIVGRKNSGKTTLVCELVRRLTELGLSVATIKHTHHNHELDTPGKDSWQHRDAGAVAVGILAAEMTAIFIPDSRSDDEQHRYAKLESALAGCDLILVEGDLHCEAAKLEVYRSVNGDVPYSLSTEGIDGIITDDPVDARLNTIARSNLNAIVTAVLQLAGMTIPGGISLAADESS